MYKDHSYQDINIIGDKISITVEGSPVEGRFIKRERRSICVEITSPYSGLSDCSGEYPLHALGIGDFLGEFGDRRAATILSELYRFIKFADEHRIELIDCAVAYEFLIAYETHIHPGVKAKQRKIAKLDEEIVRLKEKLKNGALDNIEYQKSLTPLKKQKDELNLSIIPDEHKIFDICFQSFAKTPVFELSMDVMLDYIKYEREDGPEENA